MLVAITGPTGLLGREVAKVFKKEDDVVELSHDILDITDLNQVLEVLSSYMPTVLVNCAAYTAVDRAEEEPEKANLVNGLGVRNLALACKKLDISLVHISTDYVFNGNTDTPWRIFEKRDPINAYGYRKYLGLMVSRYLSPRYLL